MSGITPIPIRASTSIVGPAGGVHLVEGTLVEVHVTGHNTGGLECEVNHIRGFIPISQIALYRVEDLAPFVDQKFPCVVTEANPERRNLVLDTMVETGAITKDQAEQAKAEPLHLSPGSVDASEAPYFVDLVRDQLVQKLGDRDFNREGLRIYTSADPIGVDICIVFGGRTSAQAGGYAAGRPIRLNIRDAEFIKREATLAET